MKMRSRIVFFIFIFSVISFIFFSSCGERIKLSRDLSFTVGSEFVTRGDTCWFKAKPNMHVMIDSVVVILKELNYSYTVHNQNNGVIYYANQYFWVDWFSRVERGQVWDFIFYGRFPFKGAAYEARTAYVVQ